MWCADDGDSYEQKIKTLEKRITNFIIKNDEDKVTIGKLTRTLLRAKLISENGIVVESI